jgi:hypothetical protein
MKARIAAWYGIFGLLPFWVVLAWLTLASRGRSSDFWLAAPWLILLAIPLCAATLVVARFTHSTYVGTKGGTALKLKRSSLVLAAAAAIALTGIAVHWMKRARLEADQEAGRMLVERALPASAEVFLRVTQYNSSGTAEQFHYSASARDSGESWMAIVEAPGRGETRLRLACVIPAHEYDNRSSCPTSHTPAPR